MLVASGSCSVLRRAFADLAICEKQQNNCDFFNFDSTGTNCESQKEKSHEMCQAGVKILSYHSRFHSLFRWRLVIFSFPFSVY